ncbi:MAG: hypothetical protein ABSC47_10125 [Terracidiphilus sp.]|jgi:hypothetical protein
MSDFAQTVKQQADIVWPGSITAQQSFDVPAASQNTQYQYVFVFDAVEDDVIPDRKTSQSWAQFLVAAAAYVWIFSQKIKAIGKEFGEAVGDFKAAAVSRDVAPDVIQIGFGLRRRAMGHYLAAACSAASRARPRCFTSLASSRMDSGVITRP